VLALISEFPPLEVVSGGAPLGSNRRFSMTAHEALEHPQIPDVWRELIRQHVSQQFLDGLTRLFGAHIKRLYPDFEDDFGAVDALRAGVRGVDSFEVSDVQLDAQISINTPVLETPDSVRESHLDAPDKLFVGLFYLRSDDDDSTGATSRSRNGAPSHAGCAGRWRTASSSRSSRPCPTRATR